MCLVSTFIDDGLRMWLQWTEQCNYMNNVWSCGWFLATMFVFLNLVSQLACCVMVLGRIRVGVACGILFGVIIVQVCITVIRTCTHMCSHSEINGHFPGVSYLLLCFLHCLDFSQNRMAFLTPYSNISAL